MEEEVSAFWEKKRIFERSIEERPENKVFVFYDGPPFATGLPHYGHLLQSTIKDVVPRYWTMQGYRVPRRWGWDCHGLPIENLIEKKLGLSSKRDIEAYGIDKFNQACRASVSTYEQEWDRYIKRLGRWVDFEHSYKTMDNDYIESVWWIFSELHRKGYVYKDLRVSLYCPRCATPLSNFEIAMGDSYEDREDPAITVKFKVKGMENTYLLAWTTTPWTLLANTAIAVNPDLEYCKVRMKETGEEVIFAKDRKDDVLKRFFPLKGEMSFEILERIKGSRMVGWEYEPLYSFLPLDKKGHCVIATDYVSAEEGTGLVHTAPAFGEDDFNASKKYDLSVLMTTDGEGCQRPEMGKFAGLPVKESDQKIIDDLKARGLLFDEDKIIHSVPVCWRCNTLLLYKAQSAWFVNITKLKPKLLEAAKKINWHPEHLKEGRFGKGLQSAPDWCISRTRFWGAPLPVWECESCHERKIISSIAEMKKAAVEKLPSKPDLHRPEIDKIEFTCACGGRMARIKEVFDCWFESGSMPYASAHYPFENTEWFDDNFPANFIAEAQDQTRGWFYSMHVLATALFNKASAKHVIVTGMILAEDGKKLSKKLKNYTDPWELITNVGADALRYYLLSSPVIRAENLNFVDKDCELLQRLLLQILWNVRAFYLLYAGTDKNALVKPRSAHILDRWIFARFMKLNKDVTESMDGYDLVEAARAIRPFVDDLSTWWLRRSRDRMKGDDEYDKQDALRTLREILLDLSTVMAPFTPFFAERLYQDLEGSKMSVHLERWPKLDERLLDVQLLEDMEWAREVASRGLEARATAKIPVRQALASLTIVMRDNSAAERLKNRQDLIALIRDELNVESVLLQGGQNDIAEPEQWIIELDTKLTPELKKKGMLRELSRQFMNLRKQAELVPDDRIEAVAVVKDKEILELLKQAKEQIMREIRAEKFEIVSTSAVDFTYTSEIKLGDIEVKLGLRRI